MNCWPVNLQWERFITRTCTNRRVSEILILCLRNDFVVVMTKMRAMKKKKKKKKKTKTTTMMVVVVFE
jgi:hypothetical protein